MLLATGVGAFVDGESEADLEQLAAHSDTATATVLRMALDLMATRVMLAEPVKQVKDWKRMTIPKTVPVLALGIALGFAGGLFMSGLPMRGQVKSPTPKEPVATADEFNSHVIHYPDLPMTELVKGSNSRLIAGEQSMISFLTMDKHSYFAPHQHRQEQIMIVLDGSCDEIIEGKLYRVKKGDVVILPPNIVHGAYIHDEDVHVIDVFGEVRSDYLLKMEHTMADMNKKK
jgi:quercetin dioxygenase-like cupin family protein